MSTQVNLASFATCSAAARAPAMRRASIGAAAALLAAPLYGCGVNKIVPPPVMAYDYHDRHPVVLADATHTIDVFPPAIGGRLDSSTAGRIQDFVARWRQVGHGQITILAPTTGSVNGAGVAEVRRALAMAGVRGSVMVGAYPVMDPSLAAPIRLSFEGIKAKSANRCGEWPGDLASGAALEGWQNMSYWNFGCASQTTLSAQVADPRDLAAPRGPTPVDIEMRMRAIGKVRLGDDPTTRWNNDVRQITQVGGG